MADTFVKVIYAAINKDITYRSLMEWEYSVQYFPGEWVRPALYGSKLIAFKDLKSAISFYGLVIPKSYPYYGKMLWYCQVSNPAFTQIIRMATRDLVIKFWKLWNIGWRLDSDYKRTEFSWIYRYKEPTLAVVGDSIKLTRPVLPEEMQKHAALDYSYLDK